MNRTVLTSIVLAGCLAVPAVAQQPAGGSGRALDANPQVGSGGNNAAAPQIDYRVRNDLVTGNVTGTAGFRDGVGYTAPGEFRGGLGSDTFFEFRARSLPPATGGVNVPGRSYAPLISAGGAGNSVYREYSTLAGQSLVTGPRSPTYLEAGSRLVAPTPAGAPDAGALYASPLAGAPTTGLGAQRAGIDSRTLSESTLLGVRLMGDALDAGITARPPASAPKEDRPADGDPDAEAAPLPTPEEQEQIDAADPALNRETRVDIQQKPQLPATGFEALEPRTATSTGQEVTNTLEQFGPQSPTLLLGQRLTRAPDSRDAQYARQIHDSIFQPNTGIAPGQSIYNDLLTDVSKDDAQTGPADSWKPTFDVAEPADEDVRRAEEKAIAAIRQAYGLQDDTAEDQADADEQQAAGSEIDKLMEQLNYNLPAITTMAGQATTRANEMIRQAEAAMTAGDFFKAESNYKQALMYKPDDPMAQVGMAHAQLGAGLFRSAALTLRRLYERHPELIAARYDARLLPGADRLRWVQAELNKLADSPDASADSGLLMAYLGYQINSRQLLRYGMALAQARNPRDPLLTVLRRIWLDEEQPGDAADTTDTPQN